MPNTVLITGGAGFIGRHIAKALSQRGYRVKVLDSLLEQVHGPAKTVGSLFEADVDLHVGDIRDKHAIAKALKGVDKVVHLAAEVGVGQSMYEIERYVSVNDLGTAVLLEALINNPVERLVTASSMSIYGEGLYRNADGELIEDAERLSTTKTTWDPVDRFGRRLEPVATPEWKRPNLSSVYALTKYSQERLTMNVCGAYGIPAVALRLFNVYGSGQALSNPYTGVLAIFASRLLNGKPPLLFEDGRQRRDFVHVNDVARAFVAALEHERAPGGVFNIGSGHDRTILDVGRDIAKAMNREHLTPEITGKARSGDIRHCFADVGKAQRELNFVPEEDFACGLVELAQWVAQQHAIDRVQDARRELEERGLVA